MTDREKLIELLLEIDSVCDASDCCECCEEGCYTYRAADHLIANGVRLEEKQATSDKNKWISVEDRLPEEGRLIIAYNGSVEICIYERAKFIVYDDNGYLIQKRYVTHWMPLPEPPKEW